MTHATTSRDNAGQATAGNTTAKDTTAGRTGSGEPASSGRAAGQAPGPAGQMPGQAAGQMPGQAAGQRLGPAAGQAVGPEDMQWAMAEARAGALAVAPGWFRAWCTGEERWSVVNVRAATQVIVNHSRENHQHPDSWTVRALFGGHAVELHCGPYDTKGQAILVAHAVLSVAHNH